MVKSDIAQSTGLDVLLLRENSKIFLVRLSDCPISHDKPGRRRTPLKYWKNIKDDEKIALLRHDTAQRREKEGPQSLGCSDSSIGRMDLGRYCSDGFRQNDPSSSLNHSPLSGKQRLRSRGLYYLDMYTIY